MHPNTQRQQPFSSQAKYATYHALYPVRHVARMFVVRERMDAAVPNLVPAKSLPKPRLECVTSRTLHAPHVSTTLRAAAVHTLSLASTPEVIVINQRRTERSGEQDDVEAEDHGS